MTQCRELRILSKGVKDLKFSMTEHRCFSSNNRKRYKILVSFFTGADPILIQQGITQELMHRGQNAMSLFPRHRDSFSLAGPWCHGSLFFSFVSSRLEGHLEFSLAGQHMTHCGEAVGWITDSGA